MRSNILHDLHWWVHNNRSEVVAGSTYDVTNILLTFQLAQHTSHILNISSMNHEHVSVFRKIWFLMQFHNKTHKKKNIIDDILNCNHHTTTSRISVFCQIDRFADQFGTQWEGNDRKTGFGLLHVYRMILWKWLTIGNVTNT